MFAFRLLVVATVLLCALPVQTADVPKAGDFVWAQWLPYNWYNGRVTAMGTFGLKVTFFDGDKGEFARSTMAVDRAPKKVDLKLGVRVLAKFNDQFYPATVTAIKKDDQYTVVFDDDTKGDCGPKDLRLVAVNPVAARKPRVGETVHAQWRPNTWLEGKVIEGGTFGLRVNFTRGGRGEYHPSLVVSDRAPQNGEVKTGARVLASFKGGKFYPGVVVGAAQGKHLIVFDDGDRDAVEEKNLRLLNE